MKDWLLKLLDVEEEKESVYWSEVLESISKNRGKDL